MLENIKTVFLSGVHSYKRNIRLKYCITKTNLCACYSSYWRCKYERRTHHTHVPFTDASGWTLLAHAEYLFIKCAMDIALSMIAIVVLISIILITTIAIKTTAGGPNYTNKCASSRTQGKSNILKFISMRVDAEKNGVAQLSTGEKDDRIIPGGRFIRKCRINTLPQLFNILSGDLTICGSRPERLQINNGYCDEMPEFALRLQEKVGLTGYD